MILVKRCTYRGGTRLWWGGIKYHRQAGDQEKIAVCGGVAWLGGPRRPAREGALDGCGGGAGAVAGRGAPLALVPTLTGAMRRYRVYVPLSGGVLSRVDVLGVGDCFISSFCSSPPSCVAMPSGRARAYTRLQHSQAATVHTRDLRDFGTYVHPRRLIRRGATRRIDSDCWTGKGGKGGWGCPGGAVPRFVLYE